VGFLLPAAIVVVVDQITKQIFWKYFVAGQQADVIPGVLRITLVKNSGAAFGLFEGGRVFFIIASVVAIGFILYLGFRLPVVERYKRYLLGLILGGAVGNLIDRIYDGAVIDFIEMGLKGHWWPVYNVADIAVSVGAVLLLIHLLGSSRHTQVMAEETANAPESGYAPKEPRPLDEAADRDSETHPDTSL
jgi:signal peptidase II